MDGEVTAFFENRIVARGSRETVTRTVEQGWPSDQGAIRVFEDGTGRAVDLDLWDAAAPSAPSAPSRGRPRLGVVPREVTLLPRHWDWLAAQPGGASPAIRRLVDAARREKPGPEAARDAIYRFITAMCGDRPGYEEALRALYRNDVRRFDELIGDWPEDIRRYVDDLRT